MGAPQQKLDVNLENAQRGKDDIYKNVIEQITKDAVCPFCPEHLAKYHKNPILRQGNLWTVTTNMYPYKGAKFHFLLIHKNHVVDTKDMPDESLVELKYHIDWLTNEFKIPGGTLVMRCGDTALTGATVTHIHAHFIVADFDNPTREPLMARVG